MNTFDQYLSEDRKPRWEIIDHMMQHATEDNPRPLYKQMSPFYISLQYIAEDSTLLEIFNDGGHNHFRISGYSKNTYLGGDYRIRIESYERFIEELKGYRNREFPNVRVYSWPTKAQYDQLKTQGNLKLQ